MPISYPRNTDAQYVLYKISTSEVLNPRTSYPRADGGEIVGGDPDLVYLEIIEQARPEVEGIFYQISVTKTADPENGTWVVGYAAVARPVEEVETALRNAEANANEQLVPYHEQLKLMMLAIGVCLRQIEAAELTAKEEAIKTKALQRIMKIWRNDEVLRAKVAQLATGETPDPTSDYETA